VKLVSEKLPDLKALYIKHLRTLLSTEEQAHVGLERLFEVAIDPQLKQVFQSDWRESEARVSRARDILRHATGGTDSLKCKVLHALMEEAEEMSRDSAHDSVRDAALIAAAQRIKHYEIALYGTAKRFAEILGLTWDAELLDRTLQEEQRADHLLTNVADHVNQSAAKEAA